VLQILFAYAPPPQELFDTEAIPLRWPRLFAGGLVFFLVVETEKLVIRGSRAVSDPSRTRSCRAG
jgi:hypothetical protein